MAGKRRTTHLREDGLTVTFSAGLGEWNMEPLDKLVVSVDEALYKAKQQGKTVSCARKTSAPPPPTSVGFFIFPEKMKPVSIIV